MFKILMASQNLWSVKSHVECKIRSYVENHSMKIRYSKGYSSSPSQNLTTGMELVCYSNIQ